TVTDRPYVEDPACGRDGGADPEEFFAFDKEITDAGVVVSSFSLEDECVYVHTDASGAAPGGHVEISPRAP
ncbi:MAG: hypothetical protein WBG39_07185, partial [Gordonia sp. (in: high G+C Gram-positive bacteria)]